MPSLLHYPCCLTEHGTHPTRQLAHNIGSINVSGRVHLRTCMCVLGPSRPPTVLICILSSLLKSQPDRSRRRGKDVDMWENATVSPGCTPRKLLGGQGVARSTSGLSQACGSHRLWWQPPCRVMQKYWEWKQRRPDRPHPALAYVPVPGPAG